MNEWLYVGVLQNLHVAGGFEIDAVFVDANNEDEAMVRGRMQFPVGVNILAGKVFDLKEKHKHKKI